MKSIFLLLAQLGVSGLMAAQPVTNTNTNAPAGAGAKLDPRYPYRVTWANEHLPWYQLKPGKFPPDHSDRRMSGELVRVDAENRRGQFRLTSTGELVDFTMLPFGTARYLNAECDLRDVPVGTQMLFFLYEDEQGRLTRVSQMADDFTILAGHSWTCRLDKVDLQEKKIYVTRQKLSKDQLDLGKSEFLVDEQTRIWKGQERIQFKDLVPGDSLIMNQTGKTRTAIGRCTDVWVGTNTHAQATIEQWTRRTDTLLKDGMAAWVEESKAGQLNVMLFSNAKKEFKAFVTEKLKPGREVWLTKSDEKLSPGPTMAVTTVREVKSVPIEGYGCSGVRLVLETSGEIVSAKPGTYLRVHSGKEESTEARLPRTGTTSP